MLQLQVMQARQILIALGYQVDAYSAGGMGRMYYVKHGIWSKKRKLPLLQHEAFIPVGLHVAAFTKQELCDFCVVVLRSLDLDDSDVGKPDA
jgi:hypothetical protein